MDWRQLHLRHKLSQCYCIDLEKAKEGQERMGCDGGTIPRRDEMVKLKKKAQKVNVNQGTFFVPVSLSVRKLSPG